jgi:hypothetical protein
MAVTRPMPREPPVMRMVLLFMLSLFMLSEAKHQIVV